MFRCLVTKYKKRPLVTSVNVESDQSNRQEHSKMSDTSALSEYAQKVLLITFQLGLVVLRPIALVVEAASVPLSPDFYPFPLATTLHALRVSHAYKGRVKALGHEGAMKARGLGVELAGYLAMVSDLLGLIFRRG